MKSDWRSDWKQPLWTETWPAEVARILERIKDKTDSMLCARCKAKVLDTLCPACLEMIMKELEAQK